MKKEDYVLKYIIYIFFKSIFNLFAKYDLHATWEGNYKLQRNKTASGLKGLGGILKDYIFSIK